MRRPRWGWLYVALGIWLTWGPPGAFFDARMIQIVLLQGPLWILVGALHHPFSRPGAGRRQGSGGLPPWWSRLKKREKRTGAAKSSGWEGPSSASQTPPDLGDSLGAPLVLSPVFPTPRVALAGLLMALGLVYFWFIPRSVDLIAMSPWAKAAYHVSFWCAGGLFRWALPRTPFVAKAAIGILTISQVFAIGVFYTHFEALLCGSFSLAEQKEVGQAFLYLSPLVLLTILGLGIRRLGQAGPQ